MEDTDRGRAGEDLLWNVDRQLVDTYVDHFEAAKGMVREELVDRQISEHLHLSDRAEPPRLVDIGGGAGNQTFRFAARGCHVTLVEPSPLMLARAEQRLVKLPADVRDRVRLLCATADEARSELEPESFDVAMSHGVLMYLDSPKPLVDTLVELTRPGGLVSVLTKSREALAARPALKGDFAAALKAFEETTNEGWLGVDTRGDTVAGLSEILTGHGARVLDWYGVGVFSDHRDDLGDVSGDLLAALIETEYRAAKADPYRGIARLIHVIAAR